MAISKQQKLLTSKIRSIIRHAQIIENWRPDILKNPHTGYNLEIDIYIPKLKLGIEFQGYHHFLNGKSDGQRHRDNLKRDLARENKIMIIEFFEQDLDGDIKDILFKKLEYEKCSRGVLKNIRRAMLEHQSKRVRRPELVKLIQKNGHDIFHEFLQALRRDCD